MSDYLWDKTGEPDSVVKHFEEILGEAGYKERPLELPPGIGTQYRPSRWRPQIAAAAVMLVSLALLLVFTLRHNTHPAEVALTRAGSSPSITAQTKGGGQGSISTTENGFAPSERTRSAARRTLKGEDTGHFARESRPVRAEFKTGVGCHTESRQLPPRAVPRDAIPVELAEARVAKEQLLLALRVVSSRLNLVQRKAPGITSMGASSDHRN